MRSQKTILSCKKGFDCQYLFQQRCTYTHTEEQLYFADVKRFFVKNFGESRILCTVIKTRGLSDKLIPFNKFILDRYPYLTFDVRHSDHVELSEQFYYEVEYLKDVPSQQGRHFVKILDRREAGRTDGHIEAFLWKHMKIYPEPCKTNSKIQYGIVKSKHDGRLVIKSHMGKNEYFFKKPTDMNRAFEGCQVKFVEVEGNSNAKIISIEKNPFKDSESIYGYLEITPDAQSQIQMQHLYYPLPENIDWNIVNSFIVVMNKTPTQFFDAWDGEDFTKEQFKEFSAKQLGLEKESSLIAYIIKLIFGDEMMPKKKKTVRRALFSLYNLNYQRMEMRKMNICFLKPINTKLPTFICFYIQNHLEATPEIWRQYVKAKFVDWPANSNRPFAVIESAEGQIGHPESDPRVILKMNSVKTDGFSKKVTKEKEETVKLWNKKINSETQIATEKVFSIDGEKVKNRDDAFSEKTFR